jgi:hypothetical protein
MSKKEWKNTAIACLKVLIVISSMGVRMVMNCNYIQYRMEFRIWSLRNANRNPKLYGVYSAKSWQFWCTVWCSPYQRLCCRMVGRLMNWSFVFDVSVKLPQNLLKFRREIWHLPSLATGSSDPFSYVTDREGQPEIAVGLIMHAVQLESLTNGASDAAIYR